MGFRTQPACRGGPVGQRGAQSLGRCSSAPPCPHPGRGKIDLDWTIGAEQEAAEAAAYCDRDDPGLGDEFLDAVETAVQTIVEAPEPVAPLAWVGPTPGYPQAIRSPLPLFDRLLNAGRTTILAVAHEERRPGCWFARARGPALQPER